MGQKGATSVRTTLIMNEPWQVTTDRNLKIWESQGVFDNFEYDSEEERSREDGRKSERT